MSTKRILGIAIFGVIFIAVIIGLMLVTSFFISDDGVIELPRLSETTAEPGPVGNHGLPPVEVTADTVQKVIATLNRPETYTRDITIERFWEGGGSARQYIRTAVTGGVMSLWTNSPDGSERRVIVTADRVYIWYSGDRVPFSSYIGAAGNAADEWRAIFTYEDVLALTPADIIETGFAQFGGESCIYVVYRSPQFGYTIRYYVSIELGLLVGAEEHDRTGSLVYRMTVGETMLGEADPSAFMLPDGSGAA